MLGHSLRRNGRGDISSALHVKGYAMIVWTCQVKWTSPCYVNVCFMGIMTCVITTYPWA